VLHPTETKEKWFWVLGSGFWVLGSGFWVLGSGFWVLGSGFWVLGSGFWERILTKYIKIKNYFTSIQH
jgi:hypothetical protein